MYQEQKANMVGAVDEQRPEGVYTSRIRAINNTADDLSHRLGRVLESLRGTSPPSPVQGSSNGPVRQSCIEDYLQGIESSHKTVEDMMLELERLVG